MVQLANVDALTGVANRHQFGVRLDSCFADPEVPTPCTLFMLDLDNFKVVNDTLGHAAGDQLLQEIARRLGLEIESAVLLARLGGDEFALIYPGQLSQMQAHLYVTRLQAALARPWEVNDNRIDIRASIGVAFAPADATSAEDLLRACDMALYAAKAAGRNAVGLYSSEIELRARRKGKMLSQMKEGMQRGEFVVHYQPQIDFVTGIVAGFEALVLWQQAEHGLLPPDDFIPLSG